MKTFNEFLTESTKTYKFKVRVAGELPEKFADNMKAILSRYEVLNVSAGKTTPISQKPMDFPSLQNMEVTHYEIEVKYPTTSQVLAQELSCCAEQGHLIVRGDEDPVDKQTEQDAIEDNKAYESLLNTEDMGGESAQESVGDGHVMNLLKELETARKERTIDPIESVSSGKTK
jgi:hypothetical protein